ncbi:MAG: HNH endonuclease, partial [Rhodococcus sp. (in: high G+C Gram-positive bacteria)]
AGAVDYWRSNSGTTAITLPGNGLPATNPTNTLIPHIPRKRRTPDTDPHPQTTPRHLEPKAPTDADDPAPF